MYRFVVVIQIVVFSCLTAYSQGKLVIDDRAGLLTVDVEEFIIAKLAEENIEYTTLVDFKARCEYYFTEISFEKDNVILTVKDCNDRVLGSKNLGNMKQLVTTMPGNPGKRSLLKMNIIHGTSLPHRLIT